jgi:hypothetical protein
MPEQLRDIVRNSVKDKLARGELLASMTARLVPAVESVLERGIELVASDSPGQFPAPVRSEAENLVTLAREAGIRAD